MLANNASDGIFTARMPGSTHKNDGSSQQHWHRHGFKDLIPEDVSIFCGNFLDNSAVTLVGSTIHDNNGMRWIHINLYAITYFWKNQNEVLRDYSR